MRTLLLVCSCALLAAAQDRPGFRGLLSQGYHNDTPTGVTNSFFVDNRAAFCIVHTEGTLAKGERLTPRIVDERGRVVVAAKPETCDGKATLFLFSFRVAGMEWARRGGNFRFQVLWEDEKKPVVDLPLTVSPARRWALLVGISDYPPRGSGGPDLGPCEADVDRLADVLVSAFGFERDHITKVKSLEATSTRIETELRKMAREARRRDAVLFYYTGHGTQVPDLDGDEEDGWDEALVTADERPALLTTAEQLDKVLVDDKLARLLADFTTPNVTVIFDCCHAGTALRAGDGTLLAPELGQRMSVSLDFGRDLIRKQRKARLTGSTKQAAAMESGKEFVFIAASRAWETGMGNANGAFFSAQLFPALLETSGESWEQLLARVRPGVHRLNPGQTPNVTGAVRRYPFSLTEAPTNTPFRRSTVGCYGAMAIDGNTWLVRGQAGTHVALIAGHGLYKEQIGAVYDVYGPAGPGKSVRKGQVVLTGRMAQLARPGSPPMSLPSATIRSGSVARGDRFLPTNVRVPGVRPRVSATFSAALAGTHREELDLLSQQLVAALRDANWLEWAFSGRWAEMDYVIEVRRVQDQNVGLVWSPGGMLVGLARGTAADIAARVRAFIEARYKQGARIQRIHNPSAPFPLRVRLVGGGKPRAKGDAVTLQALPETRVHLFVVATYENAPPEIVADTKGLVTGPRSFDIPLRHKGRTGLKVFASAKKLKLGGVKTADDLFQALRRRFPGGEKNFLGTNGWADETIFVDVY